MLKNYLKIAWRNCWRYKGYTTINIFGLAAGLATCILLLLYVWDELHFDRFNTKAGRIYRVDSDIQFGGNHFVLAVSEDPIGPTLKKDFPQVEQYVRFRQYGGILVKKGNENLKEDKVVYVDSTLFDVFTLPMTEGNPHTALVEPHSMVITETTARKYFNTIHATGKSVLVDDSIPFKITGVIRDIPSASHFNFDFFLSMSTTNESRQNNWVSNNFNTYIVLKQGAAPQQLAAQLPAFKEKYVGPQVKELMNITLEDFRKQGNWDRSSLTPLLDIHLHSAKTGELGVNGSIQFVYIFSCIGIFILLIACINFMNLATARSAGRAKEVGIRKVLGSFRKDLINQFLAESLLISFISMLLALALAWGLLPYFNNLAGKQMTIAVMTNPWLWISLVLLVIVVGLLAGSYPAFFLSAFQPVEVLKGKLSTGFRSSRLRSSLVVLQFVISIGLIISTAVIYRQLDYIRNRDIGFKRQQVLILHNTYTMGQNARSFREELLKIPGVHKATLTGFLPTSGWRNDSPLFKDPVPDQKQAVSAQLWNVDENYIPTLGMEIVQGRNFSKDFPTDSSGIILNEATVKLLGVKDPINMPLYMLVDFPVSKAMKNYHVVGVVKNFNFNSLREQVTPLALFLHEETGKMALQVEAAGTASIIDAIQKKWKAIVPSQPFAYSFMDDDFNKVYFSEQRSGKLFIGFAALAILIACLGLFALVTYAASQRTREIGIRKVLGASASNIVTMLSADFLKLVGIATLIAFPLAGWLMYKWLQDFAYRTALSWWIFAIAGVLALVIAFITISFQAIKSATANPVKSLRTE